MHDLLTKKEDELAAEQGWGLHHVYDSGTHQWMIRVLPTSFGGNITSADVAAQHVVTIARSGNPVAIKALRILMHGPQR